MRIQLSDHFTYPRLFRFTLPSVVMMIFTSIYSVVDGLFISNVVGSNALSSINIVMPLAIVIGAFGFMLGTGGSAEVAKTLGEGKRPEANRYFSLLILTIAAIGAVLSVAGIVFIRPICRFLGASDLLIDGCVTYGIIMLAGSAAFMLQTTFQTFFVVAEKPHLGLALTVAAGVTNMVLDFVFVYLLQWGLAGAAIATVCGYVVGGVVPLIYFLLPNSSLLRLGRTRMYGRMLWHSCTNGSSEMLSNLSMSLITFLYNWQMMRRVGEDGVAAITVITYVNFIFVAILIGFVIGTAPLTGYNYGAGNHEEMHNLFRKALTVVGTVSVSMALLSQAVAVPLVSVFLGRDNALAEMTVRGFRLYSISFLLCGINIFASSFFTALCNGRISALISFLRSLALQGGLILLLPLWLELDGIWLAVPVAELLTVIVSVYFLISRRGQYHYA